MIKGKTNPKTLAFPIKIKLNNVLGLPYTLGNNVSFTLALAEVKIIVCKLNLDHNVLPRSKFGKLKYLWKLPNFHVLLIPFQNSMPF